MNISFGAIVFPLAVGSTFLSMAVYSRNGHRRDADQEKKSGQFLLGAVTRPDFSNHKRAQPVRSHSDTFDPIRRFRALDYRLFP